MNPDRSGSAAGPGVTFFLADASPALADLDRDAGWRELETGERAWILQTYLVLRRAGLPVELSAELGGRCLVFHAKDWRRVERLGAARRPDLLLVAVRGDLRPAPNADFEVVQNPAQADARRSFYLPHWPQPGLRPRDAGRGTALRRAAFKGFRANLHPGLRDPAWTAALAKLGVEWVADEVDFRAGASARERLAWPDFRNIDVIVALRPSRRDGHLRKPPTKLLNAWLAGVPAILGPEEAYRRERRSPLDYLEAADPAAALAAVERLIAEPDLYRAMVENGARRAAEVTPEAFAGRWRQLLWETIPTIVAGSGFARTRRLPRPLRLLAGRIRRARG